MEFEEISGNNENRASQRDRERERRRIRDRQRRQSMSQEERERHLARRRRNYQLRRQRTLMLSSTNDNLEPVPVTEIGFQFNDSNPLGYGALYDNHNASENKSEGCQVNGEGKFQELAKNPGGLRLHQIKHLARLLNTSLDTLGDSSSLCGTNISTNGTSAVKCELKKTIRLVHVKRLARALHSTARLELDGSSSVEEAELVQC